MLIATITLDEKDVNVMTAFASFIEELSDIAIVQEFLDFTGVDGDVAGPQPSAPIDDNGFAEAMEAAGFKMVSDDGDVAIFMGSGDEDHPLDAEVRAHVEGDLNGDGVVDEKDEAIRLGQLADDGNPHVGE